MGQEARARRRYCCLLFVLGAVSLSGCRPKVDYLPGGNVQTGIASWYGGGVHGKRTSSREGEGMKGPPAGPKNLPLVALRFSVQTGSFIQRANAEAMRKDLARQNADVYVSTFETARQVYYRVRIRAKDRETADTIARRIMEKGYTAIIFEEQ